MKHQVTDWEIELNNHIEVICHPDGECDEYVPYKVAKAMIREREREVLFLKGCFIMLLSAWIGMIAFLWWKG